MGLRNIQGVASTGPRERVAGERKENSRDNPRFWLEQPGRLVGTFTELGGGGAGEGKTTRSILNLSSVKCYGTTKTKSWQAVRSTGLEFRCDGIS